MIAYSINRRFKKLGILKRDKPLNLNNSISGAINDKAKIHFNVK
jgi:hypothetical protein